MASEYPLPLRAIRLVFPLVERFFPGWAGRWAVSLFIRPFRFGFTAREREYLAHRPVEQFPIDVAGKRVMVYRMGTGPEVICVHGWAGRAMQFRLIADALVAKGFTFLSFDAWAHGQSKGKSATLFDFADELSVLLRRCKHPVGVIGHSLGAAATSFLISEGGQIPSFVAMGAPVIAQDILDQFCLTINASRAVQIKIRAYTLERFHREFDHVAMEETFKKVHCPVLAIHGESDKAVSIAHLRALTAIRPGIEVLVVPGAGHRSILKDEQTVGRLVEWLQIQAGKQAG